MNPELQARGVAIVRGLLSGAEAESLKGLLERAYAAADNGTAHVDAQERVRAWGGVNVHLIEQFGIDEQELIRFLGMVETRATKEVGPCKLIPNICVFRRHRESRTHVPWHIDADGAGTVSYDPCVNIWIPLVSVGRSLPSLKVIPGSHVFMRELPLLNPPSGSGAGRTDEWVDQNFVHHDRLVAQLEPGDALMFDHYTLHRTQPMDSPFGARISGEFRVQLACSGQSGTALASRFLTHLRRLLSTSLLGRPLLSEHFMALFNRRAQMLEVQNRSLITTARERSGRIDELERELQATRQRAEQTDKLERELQTARERAERTDKLERELQTARERAERTDKLERELQAIRQRLERIDQLERELQQASHEVERLTLGRDFYSKRVLELEEQNRQLTEAATNYSLQGQKRERELTEVATRYSLWGQKLERELAKIDPDGAPARRFEAFQTKGPTES